MLAATCLCAPNYASSVTVFLGACRVVDRLATVVGQGPGLTPSHDDTLTGMLLAARYFGALNKGFRQHFFAASGNLEQATTVVSVSYLRYAALQVTSLHLLLHFTHALRRQERLDAAIDSLLALGHTSGADTLAWGSGLDNKS